MSYSAFDKEAKCQCGKPLGDLGNRTVLAIKNGDATIYRVVCADCVKKETKK